MTVKVPTVGVNVSNDAVSMSIGPVVAVSKGGDGAEAVTAGVGEVTAGDATGTAMDWLTVASTTVIGACDGACCVGVGALGSMKLIGCSPSGENNWSGGVLDPPPPPPVLVGLVVACAYKPSAFCWNVCSSATCSGLFVTTVREPLALSTMVWPGLSTMMCRPSLVTSSNTPWSRSE